MSLEAPPPSSSFNDRSHWPCRWNWCNNTFITQTQLVHHINEAHIQTMKSVKRRDLKAILQEEPGSPSAPSLSPLERLANQTIVSQSTTNSSQPPEKTKPASDSSDSTRSDALAPPSEVPIQPEVSSTSLEPPPPPPVGFRRFRTLGGLRGETPSPAPLPPSPDVSELIFHAAGSRIPLPPQPPASPSPSKKRPRSPTTRSSMSMSRSPSPTRSRRSPLPDRSVNSPAPGANSAQSTNLTPFAKRLKVSRQTPPPPAAAAAALLSRATLRTPSPQRRAAVSSPSPAVSQPHQAPRDPSSSPIARSAPPTTPSHNSLPSEPGSSPFPEEDEDEKDDGPDTDGKPRGERAATGDLDELEEFYGTKDSGGGAQDVGDDEGEQSQSQSLNVKDPFGFQTQAFPKSTLGEDSY